MTRIQNRISEIRKLNALKQGLADMIDFDSATIAESIMDGSQAITEVNLRSWCGLEGWEIDFEAVVNFIKASSAVEQQLKPLNKKSKTRVSKQEFIDFLEPKKKQSKGKSKLANDSSYAIWAPIQLTQEQKRIRQNLHIMQLLDLFKHVSRITTAKKD